LTHFTGEIIAFLTVLCWTVGSQFFEAAGKRVGSLTVNLVRLVLAAVFLCLTLLITRGQLIPWDFPIRNWGWLAVSGVIGFALGWWPKIWRSRHDAKALAYTSVGAFLGPYLGVALSLAALHYTSTGVASTIMALTPVMLIPFAVFIHKEHVSPRALAGTVIAFSGIVLLIL